MGTLTGLLHLTASALAADQAALGTTADNISNQNTEGYTRRAVTWSSGDTVNLNGTVTGIGIKATAVAQRDRILQRTTQQAQEAASASSTRVSALDNLQKLFAIGSTGEDAAGIGSALSGFFNAASALGALPTDSTARQSVYTAAQTLASTLNRAASQLSTQRTALDQQITSSVQQVNQFAAQIASLNKQIASAGADSSTDGLQDQRNLAITNMSKLIDVNAITDNDGSISLALANGASLVSGSSALPLVTASIGGVTHIQTNAAAGGTDITGLIRGGSIGGALEARDSDIASVNAQLDAIASSIATAVNAQNAAGTLSSGVAGGPIFSGTTAATLTVTAAPSDIAASPDGSNAIAIGALASGALVNGLTFADSFATMITGLGSSASAAKTTSAANAAVLSQTTAQLSALTGVSLDTEAANLTQYQRSYQAAAKVLAIVNELMAQAINLGQQTTVS